MSRQGYHHNSSHLVECECICISTGRVTLLSCHQSFPNITFPVTHTHISVIMANISQEHLVIKRVATNASRGRNKKHFLIFFRTKNISITGPLRNQSGNSTKKRESLSLALGTMVKWEVFYLRVSLALWGKTLSRRAGMKRSWEKKNTIHSKLKSLKLSEHHIDHWKQLQRNMLLEINITPFNPELIRR